MAKPNYRRISANAIVETIDVLCRRVSERFAGSGLESVCYELGKLAREDVRRVRRSWMSGEGLLLRLLQLATYVFGAASIGYLAYLAAQLWLDDASLGEKLEGVDATASLIVAVGAVLYFIHSLSTRRARGRMIRDLHQLRSFAHVIDMHQLTKDPTVVLNTSNRTASSPERTMTPFELTRYLEYCAEMLSLVAKLAAIYAQTSRDTEVVAMTNDIENLTTDLARKIWQKIIILGRLAPTEDDTPNSNTG